MPALLKALFTFCILLPPTVLSQTHYKLCYAESWLTTDVDGLITGGPLTKSIIEIFRMVDPKITLEMRLLPWKRCQRLVEKGVFDGLMRIQKTEERKNKFVFSVKTSESYLYFIYLTKSYPTIKNWQKASDFKGKILGAVNGNPIGDVFKKARQAKVLEWQTTSSDELNLRMLIAKRIDFLSWEGTKNTPLLFSDQHIEIIGKHEIKALKKPHMVTPLYMAFSKVSPILEILPQINNSINTLQKEGKMEMEYWSTQ